MNRTFLTLAAASLAILPTGTQAAGVGGIPAVALGTWINPRGTVKVATGNCAGKLCGWVVWAAPQALADARAGGVTRLIGTELLQNYHAIGPRRYQGQVFVPDMGRTFYSTIEQRDASDLKISGCILGGIICKSQTWRRI